MLKNRLKMVVAIEVVAVVLIAAFLFRGLSASQVHQWELSLLAGQSYYIVEYAAVLALVLGLLLITRRNFTTYGITFKHPWYLLTVTAVALLPFLLLGATLSFVNWHKLPGALLVSLVALGVLVIVAFALRNKPASREALALGAWIILVPVVFTSPGYLLAPTLVKTLYFYLLVGPAEETLFRGYIQSRLNEAWGQPYRFFGVAWGWGVVFASILFGLWHVLIMPSASGVWLQAMWTACAGLALGYLRERSRSIVPSSFLHSVMNYLPFTEYLG
jgi:membrane protease YdiL (CAAX protease family)